MRADDDVDRAAFESGQRIGAVAALFAAGQDRDLQPGAGRQRRDGGKVLPRQDFGRRHQRRLSAGLDRARHGEQRHDRLAGADVALQQAQHALRLGEIGIDLGEREFLRAGQRVGQGFADGVLDPAVAGQRPAGKPPHIRARQRQRHLSGQELVIGEPAPGSALRRHVDRVFRIVQPRQRRAERRKALAARQFRVEPFRQRRQPRQRLADGAAQHLSRQAGGQRIDRLDQRQVFRIACERDMVGMHHGRPAVEPLHAARHHDMLADRHRLFEIGGMRVEEGQPDLAGVVMREDPVRHRLVAARRRLVPVDAQFERHDLALGRAGDARPVAPVDDRMRQHEQQVAGARMSIA